MSIFNLKRKGIVLFFTGLPCSGKTTIAKTLVKKIKNDYEREVTYLDGDIVRENLSKGLTFSKEDRDINIKRIGYVAGEVVKHDGVAVCAAIAPHAATREYVRHVVGQDGNFMEIYVDTPLDVCEDRDVKGMYKKARKGIIKDFTGVDDPYDIPVRPEIILETQKNTPEQCADTVLKYCIDSKIL